MNEYEPEREHKVTRNGRQGRVDGLMSNAVWTTKPRFINRFLQPNKQAADFVQKQADLVVEQYLRREIQRYVDCRCATCGNNSNSFAIWYGYSLDEE